MGWPYSGLCLSFVVYWWWGRSKQIICTTHGYWKFQWGLRVVLRGFLRVSNGFISCTSLQLLNFIFDSCITLVSSYILNKRSIHVSSRCSCMIGFLNEPKHFWIVTNNLKEIFYLTPFSYILYHLEIFKSPKHLLIHLREEINMFPNQGFNSRWYQGDVIDELFSLPTLYGSFS